MQTNKEKMLKMVLDNPRLKELYDYHDSDYDDLGKALKSDKVIVAAVAQIIKDYNESTVENDQRKVYMKVFNYINDNYEL